MKKSRFSAKPYLTALFIFALALCFDASGKPKQFRKEKKPPLPQDFPLVMDPQAPVSDDPEFFLSPL